MKIFNGIKMNKGMTYVELIVVLSIFSVLSSVAIFNYGGFQDKVDIKNLGSDIALKIVEAQKSALNGVLPQTGIPFPTWKPSYGVYFNTDSKLAKFIYFADLNNLYGYEEGEELETIEIKKGNFISKIENCSTSDCLSSTPITILSVYFARPSSSAVFVDEKNPFPVDAYVRITIESPKETKSYIKIYPSGRIDVK